MGTVRRAGAQVPTSEVALHVTLTGLVALELVPAGFPLPGLGWAVAFLVPLWWRRAHPHQVMALLVAVGGLQLIFTDAIQMADVALLVGLHAVAAHATEWRGWLWLAVFALGITASTIDWNRDEVGVVPAETLHHDLLSLALVQLALAASAWTLGRLQRARRILAEERSTAALARQEQEIRLALADQRDLIARELHDTVGHALALIAVQADAGRYVATAGDDEIAVTPRQRLDEAAQTLDCIHAEATRALGETRALVRGVADGDLSGQGTRSGILDLVEPLRRAGLPVTLDEGADGTVVRPEVDLAIRRCLQEALTNAVRHAPGSTVAVTVDRGVDACVLRVVNDRADQAMRPEGIGLAGMRHRVAELGGRFEAGPQPPDRFVVDVRIPGGG